MKRVLCGSLAAVLILLLNITTASAQGNAQISGTVRDDSGGVLPGADVTVTKTDTGLKRNVVTDANGAFSFPSLPVGPYRLDVMLQGFRSYAQTGIVLQVNENPVVAVTLPLGQVAETITVQGNTTMIETRNMGVGQILDNRKILDLPLNGRNPAALIETLPAAVPQPLLNATSRSMQGGLAYSVAGGLTFGITYTLDGAIHNNPYDNLSMPLPFPDALQEARLETSAMTAQNGMHSSASLTAVTKSGTNQFRGDAFEFFRHHDFNATDPFAAKNADGSSKDDGLKRNQYGATVGGPIKTDKLFFFAGYQGTNTNINPTDNRAFVPTAAMLAGDFTVYASPACNSGRVIPPLPAALGFAGNRIDPSRFSPAALNITSKLPQSSDPCGLVQYGLPNETDERQFVGKLDHQWSSSHSLFGRYIATNVVSPPPYSLDAAQQDLLVTRQGGRDNLAQTFTAGENWVISPTTLNSVRFSFNRTSIHRTSTDFFSAPDVGVNIYSYRPAYMLLTVGTAVGANVNGFQLGGGTESESTFDTNAWQISDDVTLVRGGHQFGIGANVAGWTSLSLANVRSPGQLTVTGAVTGLPLSDFLLGRLGLNGLVQAAPNTLDMQQRYIGLYAQDTWRLGPRVTLNYGLRWEPFFPQQLVNGAVYQFDMARFQQKVKSTVFPNAPAGLYFPDDPGFPSQAGMQKQWKNLGPRVGISWDPSGDGRTSVRASYGRSFEFVNAQFHLNTSVAPPWGSEVRLNNTSLDNPFLGSGQPNIFPVTFDKNAPFSLNGPFLSLSNDMQATNVHLWNITVERQIGASWFASAGYVGSRTNNIWESTPLNNALPITINGVAPSVANTNARRPLTLADPDNGRFYGPLDLYVTDGKQHYNGLLLSFRRSSVRGVGFTTNYTLSHCSGSPDGFGGVTTNVSSGYNKPEDPHFDDGNCAADRLHNFTTTASIESPRLESAAMRAAFSGWRLVGSFRALTGSWLSVSPGAGNDRALNGQAGVNTQRANQVLDDPFGDDSIQPGGGRQYLNPSAFAQPDLGTQGTMVRNSIRGPGYKNLDFALTRQFRLAGQQNIEIRVEAFNVFNWLNWGLPNTNLNSPTFGQITSNVGGGLVAATGSTPGVQRVMQFAIKYLF